MRLSRTATYTLAGTLAVSLSASIALRAQGRGGGAPAGPTLVPMTAASLLAQPQLYIGQTVAVTAAMERTLTKTTFTVDQDSTKALPKDLLIIAPTLVSAAGANTYVTIVGEAIKFDPALVATKLKGYTLDLPADMIEKYRGQPAVLATSVVDAALTDLAKPKPVPLTPAEEAFDKVMKQVSPAFAALRQAADGSDAAAAKTRTTELAKLFADTQAFFKTRNNADAIGWAGDAAKAVTTIEAAVTAGKWDDAKAGATALNGVCGQCHTAYRERADDGTFRVKRQ